jgi:GntR family transcriptional regulator, regulator for abcA and norABC
VSLYKKHKIRMIFLNPAFQNPSGTSLSQNRKKAVLDISSKYGIPIVEDDPYSLTSFMGDEASTLKSMDSHGNVLYISSLSKIVASGLRIGWIIGPKAVIERLTDVKQQIDFGHSSFTQWIANDFLESEDFPAHIQKLIVQLKNRRDQITESLRFFLGKQVDFQVPEGGIHIWCKLGKEINEMKLLEESIKRGIIYVPGTTMGSEKGYVRFTFARENEDNIHEGIKRFAEAFQVVHE